MAAYNLPTDIQQLDIDETIDLLVENELSLNERQQLFARLDHVENGWRRCAVAFINGQTLQRDLKQLRDQDDRELSEKPADAKSLGAKSSAGVRRRLYWPTAIAASIALVAAGVALAPLWNRMVNTPEIPVAAQTADSRLPVEQELELIAGFNRLARPFPPKPALAVYHAADPSGHFAQLIEVKNDQYEAVYYTTSSVPDFILESIILAGHRITVEQEILQIPIRQNQVIDVHVNAIRITKNALNI